MDARSKNLFTNKLDARNFEPNSDRSWPKRQNLSFLKRELCTKWDKTIDYVDV